MKIVKIGALWCPACLIVNKSLQKLKESYELELVELDYDFDEKEVKKYNIGNTLPVIIFYDGEKEYKRLIGEVTSYQIEEIINEVL